MSRGVVALLLALAVVGSASAAPMWSADGHEITARVAMLMLDAQANATVRSILDGQTLSDVSTWADEYKHTSAGKWSEPCHFVDLTPAFVCTYVESCCGECCVVNAIMNYTGRVVNESGDEQNMALKFLTHFVGDIHQPMHVANADDRGGNDITGYFSMNDDARLSASVNASLAGMLGESGKTNAHFMWDSVLLLVRRGEDFSGSDQEYADYLYAQTQPGGKFSAAASDWTTCQSGSFPCPDEWAAVSAKTACQYGYTNSHGEHIKSGFELGSDYYEYTKDTLDQQLAMGGVRLAALINKLLGASSRSASRY